MTFFPSGGGGAAGNVPVATALPAAPINGDEVILTDSLTAPTYQWHLQYDSAIVGNSKWRRIGGGGPLYSFEAAPGSIPFGSTAYQDFTGTPPSVTIPARGIYNARYGGTLFDSFNFGAVLVYGYLTPKFGAAAAADVDGQRISNVNGTAGSGALNLTQTIEREVYAKSLAAADVVKLQARSTAAGTSGNTWTGENHWLAVEPVLLG